MEIDAQSETLNNNPFQQTTNLPPGNSSSPFWDGENVTPFKG